MGLQKDAEKGVCLEDIKLAMKGHVKDNYQVQLGTTQSLWSFSTINIMDGMYEIWNMEN